MTPDELERLLHHWPAVAERARQSADGWGRGFALDIAEKARRPWWRPSPRQAAVMRAMVADMLCGPQGAPDVIED